MAETLKITSTGTGIPLVLIHGWGLNSGVWQPLLDRISSSFQIITIDLPGFGLNVDTNISPYSLENICDKIIDVVAEPAIFAGWSLGGLVTTRIALNYPEKTLGLITIASSPCFLENNEWSGIRKEVLTAFYSQLSENTKKTIEGFLKIQAMGSPHIRQDLKQLHTLIMRYPLPSKETLTHALKLLETEDLRESLSEITLPFLRLYGRLDSLVPKAVPGLVATLNQQSEQYIFDKASHAPFISHPDDFIAKLNVWLKSNFL